MAEYFFLPEDFEQLSRQIINIADKIREIGQIMGESCEEGAETYHDNFAYEDGERQQYMWSKRLRELIAVKNNARVITLEEKPGRVTLGCRVNVLDLEMETEKEFQIGSYISFQNNAISYAAPVARILIGAAPGDVRHGKIANKEKMFEILDISLPDRKGTS
jgi:transcription elongation GreA/GreB family factor